MKIVKTLQQVPKGAIKSVFLAGPTYRIKPGSVTVTQDGNDVPRSWRDDAVRYFEDVNFDGVIYLPEWVDNEKPDGWTYDKQVQWETEALNASDIVLFWIPRDMKLLPALTTNIEFGEWMHSRRVIVGAPDNAEKMDYIKSRCAMEKLPFLNSLQDCVFAVSKALDEKVAHRSNVWFTSDTHFSQERTLSLSRRPFIDVDHMDRELIRNWNFKVREEDVVYHLGDFGDVATAARIIGQLNGAHIFLIPGNYDSEDLINQLTTDPRVTILDSGHTVTLDGIDMKLIHEPENIVGDDFYLFGHIHGNQRVKTKALNVGTDCHYFKPIGKDTVMFYHNAIVNHYDDNVFQDFREA